MEGLGGLQAYQTASLKGQGKERGGDSSAVLVEWLKDSSEFDTDMVKRPGSIRSSSRLRALEVGALSTRNEISKFIDALNDTHTADELEGRPRILRIDLHSQHPDIMTQDFMTLRMPTSAAEQYDLISLSLVLNYVPSASGRGEMLRRTTRFLRKQGITDERSQPRERDESTLEKLESHKNRLISCMDTEETIAMLPALFIVLPAPCIQNSRYLTEEHFISLMSSLYFSLVRKKVSTKLWYTLWKWDPNRIDIKEKTVGAMKFSKREINPGKGRNNFCIVLE
jgi:25S rRNA (adenine2142-N1)-methyltransferase